MLGTVVWLIHGTHSASANSASKKVRSHGNRMQCHLLPLVYVVIVIIIRANLAMHQDLVMCIMSCVVGACQFKVCEHYAP